MISLKKAALIGAAVPFVVVVAACGSQAQQSAPTTAPSSAHAAPVADGESAQNALELLEVKGRAPMTGYSRDQYGPAWTDVDRDGCDTRNQILQRDLTSITMSGTCKVLSGTLNDAYTGKTIAFTRGNGNGVDIDHIVSLGNSWATGASAWPYAKRVALANDPLNLMAVDAAANRQKGDGDAATWLMSNKAFRCDYVARQIAVKTKYELWLTQPEHDAMETILGTCPGQALPAPGPQPTLASNTGGPEPSPVSSASASSTSSSNDSKVVYYPNCAAVRAAGAAPIHRGEPGYSSKLDRDGDGVACE